MTQDCFNELFIDFKEIDVKLLSLKSQIVVWAFTMCEGCSPRPDRVSLVPEIYAWCRENKIRYRKVSIENTIKNAKKNEIARIGEERNGILFYSLEDALAFKLRWG